MLFEIFMIIIGFALLILGADLLVKGSSNIAKKFHIPEILIGLTIVALGTSAPELIITITSANKEAAELIIGNVIGSNLCNLLLILGLISVIKPIKVDKEAKKIHILILILATFIILIMGFSGTISRIEGIILLIMFIIHFSYPILIQIKSVGAKLRVFSEMKRNKNNVGADTSVRPSAKNNILLSILSILIGIIFLKYGGDFVVDYSSNIAERFNVSEAVIGLTIIAFGTSLPELVTSIVAVIKKDLGLAIGNIVGSCIFNVLLILGVGAIIIPLSFTNEFKNNLILLIFSTILIWLFNFIGKKNTITRKKGSLLIFMFLIYIIKIFI